MNGRHTWIVGLTALSWMLAAPAQANPHGPDGAFMVAKRDNRDETRPEPHGNSRERGNGKHEAERNDPSVYGYGYERRQQQDQSDGKDRKDRSSRPPRR
jgi:hypothetical protein